MQQFGIIGYPLGHTFSPAYFNNKFKMQEINAIYTAYPLADISTFPELIEHHIFSGLNVTIPHKETIIPYLDLLDESAKVVGAVNTIKFEDGKTYGYNTDVYGFEQSLRNWIPDLSVIKQALVLGSGGASKAISYVLKKNDIPYKIVSRQPYSGDFTYEDLTESIVASSNLIINTTPLGMVPYAFLKPDFPYEFINEKFFLYDLVYNPEKTLFLGCGLARGCKIKNGHDMLILQAECAWQIWNTKEI